MFGLTRQMYVCKPTYTHKHTHTPTDTDLQTHTHTCLHRNASRVLFV